MRSLVKKIVFDKDVVKRWYDRDDVFRNIIKSTRFKYITFMKYDFDGLTNPPRRFLTLSNTRKSYDWMLKYGKIGYVPTSMYIDVDNWNSKRPFFSNNKDVYKEQREEFFKGNNYRLYQLNPDFVMDIDGEGMLESWGYAFDIINMFSDFGIMCRIIPSGKKGWQIMVPGYKTIKKEYFVVEGKESNTHKVLAWNIQEYLNIPKGIIDLCAHDELRFVKQPYSLDGRNMIPLVPLTFEEFIMFKQDPGRFTDVHNWLEDDFDYRGMAWHGTESMDELVNVIDEWIDKQ